MTIGPDQTNHPHGIGFGSTEFIQKMDQDTKYFLAEAGASFWALGDNRFLVENWEDSKPEQFKDLSFLEFVDSDYFALVELIQENLIETIVKDF